MILVSAPSCGFTGYIIHSLFSVFCQPEFELASICNNVFLYLILHNSINKLYCHFYMSHFFNLFSKIFFKRIFSSLVLKMYGHAVQIFPYFFMPLRSLLGYKSGGGGIFAFTRRFFFFIFGCLLNVVSGGFSKHYFRYVFWDTFALQCLTSILGTEGTQGSYLRANISFLSRISLGL